MRTENTTESELYHFAPMVLKLTRGYLTRSQRREARDTPEKICDKQTVRRRVPQYRKIVQGLGRKEQGRGASARPCGVFRTRFAVCALTPRRCLVIQYICVHMY